MQPTDGLLIALQDAEFADKDLENLVQEVIAQLDSDLTEANYSPSTTAETLYDKFDEYMKEYLSDKQAEEEAEEDEDSDDEDEDEDFEDDEDEDEDDEDDEEEDDD